MTWKTGKRKLVVYKSKEESYAAFKELWTNHYGGFPTLAQARKYTGNDNAVAWLAIVKKVYYN